MPPPARPSRLLALIRGRGQHWQRNAGILQPLAAPGAAWRPLFHSGRARAYASSAAETYLPRIQNVMSRIVELQDQLEERNPAWKDAMRRAAGRVALGESGAKLRVAFIGEDYVGKTVLIRSLLDDDTVDAEASAFLARVLKELEEPAVISYGEKAEQLEPDPSSGFSRIRAPTKWLEYCHADVLYLPGLYNFDSVPNKIILDTALLESDAVVLVSDIARQLTGAREISTLEKLNKMGRADRVVVCVNQTDRLGETEEIAVARMAKEVDQRAKIHAPGLKAPIFWTAAKRAIVAPIGLRSAVEEGVPVSPYSYQSRLASARIDVVRDYLLGRLLSPADHRSAKLLTDLAVGRYALERLEREIDVTYKSIQSYHHEVTAVVDAVRKEEQRQLDAAMKKTGSEIARVLLQSEEKATSYVAERPLWRFLWRMEPISLEATRRLMGSSLVHLNNVEGSASGFTWEGAQTLREVEILFSHAVGRTDGVMSTYATNLRNILARVAHSKVLYRHSLSRELEVEIARIVEQLDRELEFAKGMNPIRTLSSPMAGYEEKVRLEGERLQSAGDSTVLTTVGFQAAVGLGTLFAIHLGVPPPVAYGTGGALAVSAFLWMKGRWRSLKWQYGERINAHGVQLRTDLVESMKSELKRSYSTYFKNLLDAYKAAHGKVAAKIDDRGYAVREELRVLKNIMGELKS